MIARMCIFGYGTGFRVFPSSLDRELEDNVRSSELLVRSRECIDLVFRGALVLRIEVHLHRLAPVEPVPDSLANNLCWVHEVRQQLLVHLSQRSAPRPRVLERLGFIEHPP